MTQILKDKVVLLTGASRGIGAGIALELGKQGAILYGTATSEKGAASITQTLKSNGINGQGLVLNVNNNISIQNAIDHINEVSEGINILVNNAGITKDTLLMRMKDDDWDDVINTNLKSVYKLSQVAIKNMMKARYGRIINISSVVGVTGGAGQVNYSASKAGLIGLTKSLSQEIATRNITVNCIAPGFIETPMTEKLDDKRKDAILNSIPMNRIGTPKDLSSAIIFLASQESSYITGQTLHINGGLYMN